MLDAHDGVLEVHAAAVAVHDGEELARLSLAEALRCELAAVADGLRDAVAAAVHARHDGCEQCRALRAELVARGAVMGMAVDGEGLLDGILFLWNVVLYLDGFFLRQKFR